jgi:hypothetical protein
LLSFVAANVTTADTGNAHVGERFFVTGFLTRLLVATPAWPFPAICA